MNNRVNFINSPREKNEFKPKTSSTFCGLDSIVMSPVRYKGRKSFAKETMEEFKLT